MGAAAGRLLLRHAGFRRRHRHGQHIRAGLVAAITDKRRALHGRDHGMRRHRDMDHGAVALGTNRSVERCVHGRPAGKAPQFAPVMLNNWFPPRAGNWLPV